MMQIGSKTLEPYQERIVGQAAETLRQHQNGAIIAPTGAGKGVLVAAIVQEALQQDRPVLLIQPNNDLMQQNLQQIWDAGLPKGRRAGVFSAQNMSFEHANGQKLPNRDLSADLIAASSAALVQNRDDYQEELLQFASRRPVIIFDEGEGASADMMGDLLAKLAKNGANGMVLTATPYRTDGRDPLEPFATTCAESIIGIASVEEVMQTGRTVPPKFVLEQDAFQQRMGQDAADRLQQSYEDAIKAGASMDKASERAFAPFFRKEASEEEKVVGQAITRSLVESWDTHAKDRRLGMVHCDGVDFAKATAKALSEHECPPGHPRQGLPPRVAFISGEEVLVPNEHGELAPPAGPKNKARKAVLSNARKGEFDVLINCQALGVGTDVPMVDLNILACQECSPRPLIQKIGRGARSYTDGEGQQKRDNLVVDLGKTIESLKQDADALMAGKKDQARPVMANMPPACWQQVRDVLALDPDLVARPRVLRSQSKAASDITNPNTPPPKPDELAQMAKQTFLVEMSKGVRVGIQESQVPGTKDIKTRVGVVIDLQQSGLWGTISGMSPRFMALSFDPQNPKETTVSGFYHESKQAAGFVAWTGVRASAQLESLRYQTKIDQQQHMAIVAKAIAEPAHTITTNGRVGRPANQAEAKVLLRAYQLEDRIPEAATAALARRLQITERPKILSLSHPSHMSNEQLRMTRSYAMMAGFTQIAFTGGKDDKAALERVLEGSGHIKAVNLHVKDVEKADRILQMATKGQVIFIARSPEAAQESRINLEQHVSQLRPIPPTQLSLQM